MVRSRLLCAFPLVLWLSTSGPASAADPGYEGQMLRLGEVLGSLHYLRNLCGERGDNWRGRMDALISAGDPDAQSRARMVASFNRGYRAFSSTYVSCTPSAAEAVRRYMKEGSTLTRDIVARYGS